MSNQRVVDSIVVGCTEELFAAYGVRLARRQAPSPGEEVIFVGVVGFTSEVMRGALLLAPTRTPLARSYKGGPCELRDWAGELANQLLGRIKNRLFTYGVEISVSTPVVIKGNCLAPVPRGELVPYMFDGRPGEVAVLFDAELRDGLQLAPRNLVVPNEGDTILF